MKNPSFGAADYFDAFSFQNLQRDEPRNEGAAIEMQSVVTFATNDLNNFVTGNQLPRHTDFISIDALILLALVLECQGR